MLAFKVENPTLLYFVSGMWCSTCSKTVQEKASKIEGVTSAEVSYPTKLLLVHIQDRADAERVDKQIREKIEGVGFGLRKQAKGWLSNFKEELDREQSRNISNVTIGLVWFLAMWSSMAAVAGYLGSGLSQQEHFTLSLLSSIFGIPAILMGIIPYARSGLRALLASRLLTLDLFIFIGGCAAVSVSLMNLLSGRVDTFADSGAMVVAILLLTKKIENSIANRLSGSILYQINQFDDQVEVFKKDNWAQASAAQIRKNDRVRFKAGATVAFDGVLVSVKALLNCHLLSGESTTVPLYKGDSVFAGSIAQSEIEMTVEEPLGGRKIDGWAESALVSESRSHAQSGFLAKWERYLTAFALLGALTVGLTHWFRGDDLSKTIEAFFIGILIFCPCLFASIVPLTRQMVQLSLLKMGVLVNRAESLMCLNRIKRVYLDKTGTLEAVDSEFVSFDPEKKEFVLLLLKELSRKTHHPILRFFSSDREDPVSSAGPVDPDFLSEIKELPGQGVSAQIKGQGILRVGRPEFVIAETQMNSREADSVYPLIAIDHNLVGQIVVKTLFDENSKEFIRGLLKSEKTLKVEILSGDPNPTAGRSLVGLDPNRISYRGNLSPEEKAEIIQQDSLYVGDGLNDTLALAKAGVSCRVGQRILGFAPVDLQLRTPDIRTILSLIRYAHNYQKVQWQTTALAFVYNIIAFSLAAVGRFSPLGAVLAMLTSFSLLLLSSLRLLKPVRSKT